MHCKVSRRYEFEEQLEDWGKRERKNKNANFHVQLLWTSAMNVLFLIN